MSDVLLVPVTAVQPDLVTQTDHVIYVPLASKNAHGIVKIGEGLDITPDGLLSFDRSEVTIKEIALNGELIESIDKRVNIVLSKSDVGLDNVDNTSDLDKPISNATQRELSRIQGLIKGSENAVSYESYEALVNDFNILGPDVYNVGQSVFIATLKVPDLWIYDIEEEFEKFTYIDDATIESILKIDGTFKVGYYRLAALDTLKVDLSNYVTNQALELKLENVVYQDDLSDYVTTEGLDLALTDVAYQDDLPQTYIASATSENGILSLKDESGKVITFESKEPDLSGYLPLTAGSDKPITGDLYVTTAIYQQGEQVANADDLSAVTDATLSSDSKTLIITKRDGSSFNFQGGEPGVDGSTIHTGTTQPTINFKTGDIFINTSTWDFYKAIYVVNTGETIWQRKGNIKGPVGATFTYDESTKTLTITTP